MQRRFELVDNERQPFVVPVRLRWSTPDNTVQFSIGHTIDASVYGLAMLVDRQLVEGSDVTVRLCETTLCGTGNVRYSHPFRDGFRTGLQFQTTLVMQGIPELDTVLLSALKPRARERLRQLGQLASFFRCFAAHG